MPVMASQPIYEERSDMPELDCGEPYKVDCCNDTFSLVLDLLDGQ